MASWDVFHSDRLELARGLSSEEVRDGLASGAIRDDDLVRPSGTSVAWARVAEVTELTAASEPAPPVAEPTPPEPPPAPEPPKPTPAPPPAAGSDFSFPVLRDVEAESRPAPRAWLWDDDEEEAADELDDDQFEEVAEDPSAEEELDEVDLVEDEEDAPVPYVEPAPAAVAPAAEPDALAFDPGEDDLDLDRPGTGSGSGSRVALPTVRSRDYGERAGELVEDEEDEDDGGVVSLTRSGPPRVEELDLAAMVDVAFQLVLFFLVTATTVLYKTLEIPKPSGEPPPEAVAQGRNRTLDDLQEDYILVEIDPEGAIKIDREPVAARMEDLAERLRTAREKTDRKTMLLSADFATPHRSAVLAYDAANEIGLGIAIARPQPPQGPPPALRPAAAAPAAKKEGT